MAEAKKSFLYAVKDADFGVELEKEAKVTDVLWINKPMKHYGKFVVVAVENGVLELQKVRKLLQGRYRDVLDVALGAG